MTTSGETASMSPLTLFLQADVVVEAVMLGLLLASVATWGIIIAHFIRIGRLNRQNERFEREFWKAEDFDQFYETRGRAPFPSARVFSAGMIEWRRSTAGARIDKEGTRARLASAMSSAVNEQIDRVADRLNILATVGAVAPFVGLFGTVWGIMRSFSDIAGANNTSLSVVAPGIAEALFATALGLFAAIPAVIAYNRMAHGINRMEARLFRFADTFHAALSLQLEAIEPVAVPEESFVPAEDPYSIANMVGEDRIFPKVKSKTKSRTRAADDDEEAYDDE